MYDLHGLSEEKARACVVQAIRQANADHVEKIRFVTGRGKHVNNRGERGTLFKKFPEWISEFDYTELAAANAELGYYDVNIKNSRLVISAEENHLKKMLEDSDKKIGKTIEFTIALADLGMAHAQYIYAGYLENGNAAARVEKNPKKAAEYMKKAATAKLPSAMHEYARFCLHGIGTQQSDEEAVAWLWKAHNQGVIEATESLARAYANEFYGLEYDFQKAFDLHTIAAKAGRSESMRFFGALYLNGDGVQQDCKQGVEWYEKAAKLGDAKALFNMGVFYQKGIVVKPDPEKSANYFKLSADHGDPDAQCIYGRILLLKGGQFTSEAMKYLIEAAENGSESANEFLGKVCKGEEARIFLQRSAQAGNLQSQLKLDKLNGIDRALEDIPLEEIVQKFRVLSINEIGLMSSYPRYQLLDIILTQASGKVRKIAINFVRDHADEDDNGATRRLIYYYERGDSQFKFKKNPEKVLELLKKATNYNDPVCTVKLALLTESQVDIPDRYQQAFNLYEKARKSGYPPAYFYSGIYFEQGLCGKENTQLALICYEKAIELEKKEGHLQKFIYGLLDQYESITEKALAGIERLKSQKVETKPHHAQFSGLKGGFFKSSTSKTVDAEERSNSATEVVRSQIDTRIIPAQPLAAAPTIELDAQQLTEDDPSESSSGVLTYISETLSSFLSRIF